MNCQSSTSSKEKHGGLSAVAWYVACSILIWGATAVGATTVTVAPPEASTAAAAAVHGPAAGAGVQEPIISRVRLTGAAPRDARTAEDILRDFAGFHSLGNYDGAVLLARELIDAAPNHPEGYYNLACSLARLRRSDEALDALEQSVSRGCRWIEHLRIDPDLDSLRGDMQFESLLARVEQLIVSEQPQEAALRMDDWSRVAADIESAAPGLLQRYHVPGASICLIEHGRVVWHSDFTNPQSPQDTSAISMNSVCRLRRPIDLLALVAAAQQEQAGVLDLANLLTQADEIGLRELPRRSQPANAHGGANRAALVSLQTPATLLRDSPVARSIDWAGAQAIPGTVELIALAIELTSDESFVRYCGNEIFAPAGAMRSDVVNTRKNRPHAQIHTKPGDATSVEKVGEEVAPEPQWIIGHTRLGTPIEPGVAPEGWHVRTTPADVAAIVAKLMDPQSPLASSSIERVAASARLSPGGLGLAVDINRENCGVAFGDGEASGGGGVRMQIAEVIDGAGMLARWYPATGRGVVIFFNSENGPDAAARLAHIALGGR